MFDDYVRSFSTPLYAHATGRSTRCHLLWGDGVRFVDASAQGDRREVRARGGRRGWVKADALGGTSLLEFYFIDVGQGDGVLIKTPDFRHVMIDGGWPRSRQDTGKNAADFVDWKFVRDYGRHTIALDGLIASHNDADHYGGLWNLLDVAKSDELDAEHVRVDRFYHAGLSWWEDDDGDRFLGRSVTRDGDDFWVDLLDDRASAARAVREDAHPRLQGWWRRFIETVLDATTREGNPTPFQRLSHRTEYLPGFGPGVGDGTVVHILGPVAFDVDGAPAVRKFPGGSSTNTNGTSVLLRVDYGRTRILLTGDLNKASQHALLRDMAGRRLDLACDVAKACHHGSDDVSYRFLRAMQPSATIISSGDNEGHDHPRPSIIAASATTGYLQLDEASDELRTPLVYSTELGRSIDLGRAARLDLETDDGEQVVDEDDLDDATVHLKGTSRTRVDLDRALIVGGLIYGLVNVRTDGETILCATLDEQSSRWRCQTFESRF